MRSTSYLSKYTISHQLSRTRVLLPDVGRKDAGGVHTGVEAVEEPGPVGDDQQPHPPPAEEGNGSEGRPAILGGSCQSEVMLGGFFGTWGPVLHHSAETLLRFKNHVVLLLCTRGAVLHQSAETCCALGIGL